MNYKKMQKNIKEVSTHETMSKIFHCKTTTGIVKIINNLDLTIEEKICMAFLVGMAKSTTELAFGGLK